MIMKRWVLCILALALAAGIGIPAQAAETVTGPGSKAILNADARRDKQDRPRTAMRELASPTAALVFEYFNGTPVEIVGPRYRGYVKVRAEGAEGYVPEASLDYQTAPTALALPRGQVDLVPGQGELLLMAAPDAGSKELASYPDGETVEILGVGHDWLQVRVDGVVGYMDSRYVAEAGEGRYGRFLGSSRQPVNLRTGPDIRTRSQGQYFAVTFSYLFDTYNDPYWYRIRVGDTVGYLSLYYVLETDVTDPLMGIETPAPRPVVAAEGESEVAVYAAAGTGAEVLATLEPGQEVLPLGVVGRDWYHVLVTDAPYGYLPRENMS